MLARAVADQGLDAVFSYAGRVATPKAQPLPTRVGGFGGVDGLVTIEDLIEQVIGEIEDEHDIDEGQFWSLEKPGQYLAVSKTPLDEFEAEIGIDLTADDTIDEEEIDTLGGLVFMLTGRVPARGEMVSHPAGVEFEILDADPRRIKRLRVRLPGAGNAA